jgi:hypothetical protein
MAKGGARCGLKRNRRRWPTWSPKQWLIISLPFLVDKILINKFCFVSCSESPRWHPVSPSWYQELSHCSWFSSLNGVLTFQVSLDSPRRHSLPLLISGTEICSSLPQVPSYQPSISVQGSSSHSSTSASRYLGPYHTPAVHSQKPHLCAAFSR